MNKYEAALRGYPIYIATKEFQKRKHHKKRINKKWRKRYGVYEYNLMPHGEVFFNEVDRVFYMTKKTYDEITKNNCYIAKTVTGHWHQKLWQKARIVDNENNRY